MLALLVTGACGEDSEPMITTNAGTATQVGPSSGSPTSNDPSGVGATGDEPTGGATDTGDAPEPTRAVCEQYLECLAVIDPESLPAAQQGFGANGTCWQGSSAEVQQCINACQTALEQAHGFHPSEPKCALCQSDEDCATGVACTEGECRLATCGNGLIDPGEVCDDPVYCDSDCQGPAACSPLNGAGCSDTQTCKLSPEGVACVPAVSSPKAGEPCPGDECASGLLCAPFCEDYCCTQFCDINREAGCGADQPCISGEVFFPGYVPPELRWYLGFCL